MAARGPKEKTKHLQEKEKSLFIRIELTYEGLSGTVAKRTSAWREQ